MSESESEAEVDLVMEGLWKKVGASFDDDERHQAFLAYCRESGKLDEAARRYRLITEGRDEAFSGDEAAAALAKKRLGQVALVAVATLEADRTEPGAKRGHRMVRIAALIVFVLMIGMLAYALRPALGQ
ncbi:MAG: hypothetical protein JNL21_09355 [Myxococcales bacterium]|nr:hypothetical protein [Myxococcales bacterium]